MHYLLAADGTVAGAFARPQPGNPMVVELPDDDPRVEAFRAGQIVALAPTSCTKLGLKRAFSEMGLWEQVKGFIASDPDRQEEWDLATELKLSDPIMVAAIQAFARSGITIDPVQLATRANALVA